MPVNLRAGARPGGFHPPGGVVAGAAGSDGGDAPFDLCGPLPGPGTTVLEASAGTGKTFALTALVTRFVAEGTPLSSILAVTFTRMATGELRDRIRTRLVETEAALAASDLREPADEVARLLATGDPEDVAQRRARLADAVAGFDAATIATTHGFCQLVIDGLGVAGDVGAGTVLLEDPSDLVEEVVDDLYLRLARAWGPPGFTRRDARLAALCTVGGPDVVTQLFDARGVGAREDPGSAAALGHIAGMARKEVGRRLAESDCLTYDELLARLLATLEDPERGASAAARLRARFSLVLVDEFQDTDPTQWRIVRAAFTGPGTRLVLVGDPKQAIYSFRGADVQAYLEAATAADRRRTLDVNRRSDQPLIDALDALLSPLRYGHPRIVHRTVRASDERQDSGLLGAPSGAPLRFRVVPGSAPVSQTRQRLFVKGSLVEWVARDVAADIDGLLRAGAGIAGPGAARPLRPADVAVLTKTNRQSVAVRDALRDAGVPAVVAGLDNVFDTEAAGHWATLLRGILEPGQHSSAVAVALTPFVGWGPAEVASAGEASWETVHDRLRRWAALLADQGIAALSRTVTAEGGVPARLLGTVGGERHLTDLGHVAQLLHAQARRSGPGAAALSAWIDRRIAAVREQADVDERSRRLDSDAEAVQVLTVHAAKGLEWGIVYCPYLWDASRVPTRREPIVFHDGDTGRRVLDVGPWDLQGADAAASTANRAAGLAELRGEELRLMYVALTRARHQVVVWWGRAHQCQDSPLGRLLHSRDLVSGEIGKPGSAEPREADTRAALAAVARRGAPGIVAVEDAGAAPTRPAGPPPRQHGEAAPLAVAPFTRDLDLRWRRASYTSITAAAHAAPHRVGSEPEDPVLVDEPGLDEAVPAPGGAPSEPAAPAVPDPTKPDPVNPMAGMPGGTDVGTVVHRVLERVDFAADDLRGALADVVATVPGASVLGPQPPVVAGLEAALGTPLGPLLAGAALHDIDRRDRLDEMAFELPLAGGDHPSGEVTTTAIAEVLRRHLEPSGPLGGYPARLDDPTLAASLRGYLTGSLDLVVRRVGPDGSQRWYVADYKTNRLGPADRPPSAWDYRPAALDAEMQRRHYPLQAVLYLVALHRYLGWRVRGYDPATHLGGAVYLFVRGMTGPASPVMDGHPCGVWSWSPPAALVVELSALFERGDR